jgi:F420-0:gamma-glutamyl ligase
MLINSIKTKNIVDWDSLQKILDLYISDLKEKSVITITSKILSIIEKRYIPKNKISKLDLIKQEADFVLKTNKILITQWF